MYDFFKDVDRFFVSIGTSLTMSQLFIIFGGFFLLTVFFVLILTSRAYEARLIKAIDMFNNYFIDNPQINEDNLVAFNNKMKSRKVPKQLRKQWQQFVLYREHNASHYMSFDTCVAHPIRNSSFKIDILVMNITSYIAASASLLLSFYTAVRYASSLEDLLGQALILPVLILLVNFLVTIFLNLRHNAIVSDLYQNYQYFEVNIDKATKTLPDYVDYEVLFDKNEIKRGIPILYAYLQKRAEDEQRELELARLKNVEHEKFNFDEAGVAGSLVLERAMQEAENYIAERKKYNQDTEQINSEIAQEDLNYREITKEYNRQMQVSKESFANYKSALEEASSSIEANYLKKQQQQELDRQRNLEREFDTASEKHKKVSEAFQADLDTVDKFRAESRKKLEAAMLSEFATYGAKIYDEVKKVVAEKQKEKFDKLANNIKELEEQIVSKNQELENIYNKYQEIADRYEGKSPLPVQETVANPEDDEEEPMEITPEIQTEQFEEAQEYNDYADEYEEEPITEEYNNNYNYSAEEELYDYPQTEEYSENDEYESVEDYNEEFNYDPDIAEDMVSEDYTDNYDDNQSEEEFNYDPEEKPNYESTEEFNYEPIEKSEETFNYDPTPEQEESFNYESEEPVEFNYDVEDNNDGEETFNYDPDLDNYGENKDNNNDNADILGVKDSATNSTNLEEESKKKETPSREELLKDFAKLRELFNRPEKSNTVKEDDNLVETLPEAPKKKAGRPRKVVNPEDVKPKKKVGRPRKVVTEESVETEPKKKVGRPRKVDTELLDTPKRKAGRPRKVQEEIAPKKKAGRPRKVTSNETVEEKPKRKAGRPRKAATEVVDTPKRKAGRPRKDTQETKPKKRVGRPRKTSTAEAKAEPKRKVGRPRKTPNSITGLNMKDVEKGENIDKYLEEIDKAIANEHAMIEKTTQELAKNAKIKTKKK